MATQLLFRRLDPNQGCTPQTCSPEQSIYGYRPNLAATVIFLIIFILSGATYSVQIFLPRGKTWRFFNIAMILGCFSEILGYIAKLLLHSNPFSDTGFMLSVVVFTFAPAFYSAGIYFTLKHIILHINPSISRVPPASYTWTFISCDILAIVLQAVGGGLSSGSADLSALATGSDIMIAGLALQVFTMLVFGMLAADYALAVRRNRSNLNAFQSTKLRLFLVALSVAYLCILIRCAYRLAELAKGWTDTNNILREQGLFIGLDSVMCGLATLLLNAWHPAWCLPPRQQTESRGKDVEESGSEKE